MSFLDQLFTWADRKGKFAISIHKNRKSEDIDFVFYNKPEDLSIEINIGLINDYYSKLIRHNNDQFEFEFYHEIFDNSMKIISFYMKFFNCWNKKVSEIEWFKYPHPRLEVMPFDPHNFPNFPLYYLGFPVKNSPNELRRLCFILTRSVLEILDVFAYFISKHVANSPVGGFGHHHHYDFFEKKYPEEFNMYTSPTKAMICDFFFDSVKDTDITTYYRKFLKLLIVWNVPQNKSLSSFPNGSLVYFPIETDREFGRLSVEIYNWLKNVPFNSPRVFWCPYVSVNESGNNETSYPLYDDYHLAPLRILDDPIYFDTQIFNSLIR